MSDNLTKHDIVLEISEKTDYSQKSIKEIVNLALASVADALRLGKTVELRNFGMFKIQVRKKRIGRNPNQPETDVVIPDRVTIKFEAGKELKKSLRELDVTVLKRRLGK